MPRAAWRSVVRESDIVARLGGDEFAIIAVECDHNGAQALKKRLEQGLSDADVSASIGMSMRGLSGSLTEALKEADQRMYECKSQRKISRCQPSASETTYRNSWNQPQGVSPRWLERTGR